MEHMRGWGQRHTSIFASCVRSPERPVKYQCVTVMRTQWAICLSQQGVRQPRVVQMSKRLNLSPYCPSPEPLLEACLLMSPGYATSCALVGSNPSSQSLVHWYMPSLPRSIVGGLNPEGGGEAPNAPKPPLFLWT